MGDELSLAARLVLSMVFGFSAITKLAGGRRSVEGLQGFGVPAPRVVAVLLPLVEATVGVALLVDRDGAGAAIAAVVLLGLFTGVVVANLARGRRVPCPCFGAARPEPISAATVARNGWLLALAVVATGTARSADWAPALAGAGGLGLISLVVILRKR